MRLKEGRLGLVGAANRAVARLAERFEHEPTVSEVADSVEVPADVASKLLERREGWLCPGKKQMEQGEDES